jgi:hypothetical protein
MIVIMVASITTIMTIITPVAATTTTTTTTTTAIPPSSKIVHSQQPVYQEHLKVVSMTPINQTHMSVTFSGNGTIAVPNTTQTINTSSNGSALISFRTLSIQGKETIRTQDGGNETATATFYEIDRQPANSTGESKGVIIAVVNTNATSGMLAPFKGMILAGIDDIQTTTSESHLTLWGWESGVKSNNNNSTGIGGAPSIMQSEPLMNSSSSNRATTANELPTPTSSTPLTAPC